MAEERASTPAPRRARRDGVRAEPAGAGSEGGGDREGRQSPSDAEGSAAAAEPPARRSRRGSRGGRRQDSGGAAEGVQAPPAAGAGDGDTAPAPPGEGTAPAVADGAAPVQAADEPGGGDPGQSGRRRRRRRGRRAGRRRRRRAAVPAAAEQAPAGGEPEASPVPAPEAEQPAGEGAAPAGRRRARRRRRRAAQSAAGAPVASAESQAARNVREMAAELGFTVREERWFRQALYHASYVNERGGAGISSNERLEFLGDAVLNLAVGQYLFERYPDMPEGELSRLRAAVVRASTLAARARVLGLGRFALLGKGEERSGGRRRPNFLADLFEALVGAIFLDQGIGAATEFVLRVLRPDLEAAAEGYEHANYKAKLQEAVQRDGRLPITYHVLSAEGPPHARIWQCEVRIGGRRCGVGQGRTKKQAEQEAAREALLRGWGDGQDG